MSPRRAPLACLALALLCLAGAPAAAQADFGIKSLSASALEENGSADTAAASHPFTYRVSFEVNQDEEGRPEGTLRDLILQLPPGLIGNPRAVPACTGAEFEGEAGHCPNDTVIGIVHTRIFNGEEQLEATNPIYNLVPPLGVPAAVGFTLSGSLTILEASLRTGSDYGANVSDITVPTNVFVQSVSTDIWGVPAADAHDAERECLFPGDVFFSPCEVEAAPTPFLTLPTSCGAPLKTTALADSLEEPGIFKKAVSFSLDEHGNPVGLDSCSKPPFDPTIEARPETSSADSPTGLHFHLHLHQVEEPDQPATAELKDAVVTLPAGLAVNPSSANGLAACSEAQVDLHGRGPAQCPAASKLGTVELHTPLLDHPVKGAVYLARQGENPFGSLIAVYVAVDDPLTGVVVKLAGKVDPNPLTGQLVTTFRENPQLPFEDFELDFKGGPTASLTTPSTCGTYTTATDLTPWTTPEGGDALPTSSFPIDAGAGGACVQSEAQLPNSPSFEAGSAGTLAGSFAPFVLRLSRENGSQRFKNLNLTLPPGVSAKLAGVSQCSDAQLAAAEARSEPGEGILERQNPSCPAASQVGVVNVGAGSGSPVYVQGNAYLAGPYKGAPVSLAIVTPAVAGPLDLGVVVVRSALYVNEATAQVTVKSDEILQILEGIPLDVRSVAVKVDRNQFTLNPTSCEAASITGIVTSPTGQTAPLQSRFQVGGCRGLAFKPNLQIRFKGSTKRTANPKVIATLTAKPGEANTGFAQVKLPKAAFLDNAHIGLPCTRVRFAEGPGGGAACPASSLVGHAEATTPLLGYPLTGNVYLRTNPAHNLPDLVVAFQGPPSQPIRFTLQGKTDSVNGALRNTFETAPDVPVSKFRLELFGGKRGLVELSSGLCQHRNATVKLRAHNNKVYETQPKVQASCGKGKKPKRQRSR